MDTKYVVLRQQEPNPQWEVQLGEWVAHSADAACRLAAEKSDLEGIYVAVPARSWNPTEQVKDTTTVWRTKKA
jgi:hypothetical protein